MRRRKGPTTVFALALTVVLSACTSTATSSDIDGDVLVVEGYGAEYAEIFNEVIAEPFKSETGITVEYQGSGSATQRYAKILASRGDPDFDLTILTDVELYQGKSDELLAPVTEEDVPNLDKQPQKLREAAHGFGAIQDVQYVSLMFNKKLFSSPPRSWKVLSEPKYRNGALIFNPSGMLGVHQILLSADMAGGGINDVQPGFTQLAKLASYAAGTPGTSAEAVPFMERGEATVFPYLDGRAAIYSKSTDYDFTLPKEGSYGLLGALGMPAESPNKEAGYKLMNFWLRPDIQKEWAESYNVGPAISGIEFSPEFTEKHIVTPESLERIKIADPGTVQENRTDWSKQWSESVR